MGGDTDRLLPWAVLSRTVAFDVRRVTLFAEKGLPSTPPRTKAARDSPLTTVTMTPPKATLTQAPPADPLDSKHLDTFFFTPRFTKLVQDIRQKHKTDKEGKLKKLVGQLRTIAVALTKISVGAGIYAVSNSRRLFLLILIVLKHYRLIVGIGTLAAWFFVDAAAGGNLRWVSIVGAVLEIVVATVTSLIPWSAIMANPLYTGVYFGIQAFVYIGGMSTLLTTAYILCTRDAGSAVSPVTGATVRPAENLNLAARAGILWEDAIAFIRQIETTRVATVYDQLFGDDVPIPSQQTRWRHLGLSAWSGPGVLQLLDSPWLPPPPPELVAVTAATPGAGAVAIPGQGYPTSNLETFQWYAEQERVISNLAEKYMSETGGGDIEDPAFYRDVGLVAEHTLAFQADNVAQRTTFYIENQDIADRVQTWGGLFLAPSQDILETMKAQGGITERFVAHQDFVGSAILFLQNSGPEGLTDMDVQLWIQQKLTSIPRNRDFAKLDSVLADEAKGPDGRRSAEMIVRDVLWHALEDMVGKATSRQLMLSAKIYFVPVFPRQVGNIPFMDDLARKMSQGKIRSSTDVYQAFQQLIGQFTSETVRYTKHENAAIVSDTILRTGSVPLQIGAPTDIPRLASRPASRSGSGAQIAPPGGPGALPAPSTTPGGLVTYGDRRPMAAYGTDIQALVDPSKCGDDPGLCRIMRENYGVVEFEELKVGSVSGRTQATALAGTAAMTFIAAVGSLGGVSPLSLGAGIFVGSVSSPVLTGAAVVVGGATATILAVDALGDYYQPAIEYIQNMAAIATSLIDSSNSYGITPSEIGANAIYQERLRLVAPPAQATPAGRNLLGGCRRRLAYRRPQPGVHRRDTGALRSRMDTKASTVRATPTRQGQTWPLPQELGLGRGMVGLSKPLGLEGRIKSLELGGGKVEQEGPLDILSRAIKGKTSPIDQPATLTKAREETPGIPQPVFTITPLGLRKRLPPQGKAIQALRRLAVLAFARYALQLIQGQQGLKNPDGDYKQPVLTKTISTWTDRLYTYDSPSVASPANRRVILGRPSRLVMALVALDGSAGSKHAPLVMAEDRPAVVRVLRAGLDMLPAVAFPWSVTLGITPQELGLRL